LGWVELVIDGAFKVEDFGVIEVELVKWVKLGEPFPWDDWSFPWGATSFDSNLGLG